MRITRANNGSELRVIVAGKIDTSTVQDFEDGIKPYLDDISTLILDFADVDYISSAGLRVLLSLQKRMNQQGEMRLLHVNEIVSEIFEVTGFDEILTCER